MWHVLWHRRLMRAGLQPTCPSPTACTTAHATRCTTHSIGATDDVLHILHICMYVRMYIACWGVPGGVVALSVGLLQESAAVPYYFACMLRLA